uniref:B-cell antigen receptor complex-associated protein beta chain n=1 Tax=Pristiophorus japonicus TaxID=55135 RepID=UPI00398EB427
MGETRVEHKRLHGQFGKNSLFMCNPITAIDGYGIHLLLFKPLKEDKTLTGDLQKMQVGKPYVFETKKTSAIAADQRRMGGGPATQEPLTDIEIRALSLVRDSNCATTGIGADPLTQDSVVCLELKITYNIPYRAVKKGNKINLKCAFVNLPNNMNDTIHWHKIGKTPTEVKDEIGITTIDFGTESWLQITKANKKHSGVYYCSSHLVKNPDPECGAEIHVITKPRDIEKLKSKHTMKDMLILVQGILLILCLTLPGMLFFNKHNESKKTEEAETYHMYEGLEVMQSAMYEDIGNMRPADAKWTVGEQPNE